MILKGIFLKDDIQNNKLLILGKLTASLAHEIRNPLSAIKLNLDYLQMSEINNDENVECIESSLEAVNRIQQLIENTLDFSRTPNSDLEDCSLNEIALQAVGILKSVSRKQNVRIITELDENISSLILNRNKILQVFLNFLNNSMDALGTEGLIKVVTSETKDHIYFYVEDNGIGISKEDQKKIFNDFFTKKEKGTGLGLSVCKQLLDEHGAEIKLESELGKGTRFTVLFPDNLRVVK
jgi:signal transduction histidine kinase